RDADARAANTQFVKLVEEPQCRLLFAAVVSGRAARTDRTYARAQRLHSRHEFLDGGEHRLERTRVILWASWGNSQVRAASLRLAKFESACDSLSTGRSRAREYATTVDDRDGVICADVLRANALNTHECFHRPVRAPQEQHALGSKSGGQHPLS